MMFETLIYLIVVWMFVVVVVRRTQKVLPIVHAAAGARACCLWKFWICKFVLELQMRCLGMLDLQMYFCFSNTDTVRSI